jgi:hypothetical protein
MRSLNRTLVSPPNSADRRPEEDIMAQTAAHTATICVPVSLTRVARTATPLISSLPPRALGHVVLSPIVAPVAAPAARLDLAA